MTADEIVAALALPPQALVNRKLPKKLLAENAATTAADRRAIADGVEDITWVAALKPATVGVPAFRDDARHYLEVAVVTVTLRPNARAARLRELVHRAIPYPVALACGGLLSLAELRHNLSVPGKTVLDGDVLVADPGPVRDRLSVSAQPATDLAALYRGWCGLLRPLVWHAERAAQIAELRRRAAREPRMAARVALTQRIHDLMHAKPP